MAGRATFAFELSVILLCLTVGCGGRAESSSHIGDSHVSHLPAGDAVGSAFSGLYVIRSGAIAACDCRSGDCSMWSVGIGETFALTQSDGALHLVIQAPGTSAEPTYDGGIDANGEFRVGGQIATDFGSSMSLISGTVVAWTSIAARSENTFVGDLSGTHFDCDVAADLTLAYVGAL